MRLIAAIVCLAACAAANAHAPADAERAAAERGDARMAARVKAEFLHAWRGYEKYAWGHDDLKPLSKAPHDWYAQPLLMTPVDSLDTMILMGLDDEAARTRRLIVEQLSFDHDIYVKNFEITIRLLGGLLASHQLTGDNRLLALAEDLGKRLLPAFGSPTGLPYVDVNLRTGKVRGKVTNPAETGTLLLEFGTLSRLTGDPVYYDKAKRALVATHERRSKLGLLGSAIDVETGAWTDTESHIGGGIDSYYEYLWKCWVLFEDKDCLEMWREDIAAVHAHLADEVREGELWYGQADMHTGKRSATHYGALHAFFPAVLALSGDIARARRLQESSLAMWRLHHVEPEVLDYATMRVEHAGYILRPEIVESAYTLHHLTRDPRYPESGRELFEDLVRCCRVDAGYASLTSVVTGEKRDRMESFLFAETFKYFYLLFAPPDTLRLEDVVFNTEAHPLRRTWKNTAAVDDPAPQAAEAEVVPWKQPRISSPQFESHPAFDPRNGDLYFVRSKPDFTGWRIYVSRCGAEGWAEPEPPAFAGDGVEADPWFTPDGRSLYFISTRTDDGAARKGLDMWRVDRDEAGKWGRPERLPEPLNSPGAEWFPRLAADGWLYFGSTERPGGLGGTDLWRGRRDGKGEWQVENLGPSVNTSGDEYEPELAPDGKRMVLMAGGGLFESRRQGDAWTPRARLTGGVHVNGTEIGALLSPSGRYMLFARDTGAPDSGELFLLRDPADAAWPPRCPRTAR